MFSESHTAQQEEVKMASNIVQCLLVATLAVVTMHPRAVFTFSAHLPNSLLLDTPDALEAAADDHQNDQRNQPANGGQRQERHERPRHPERAPRPEQAAQRKDGVSAKEGLGGVAFLQQRTQQPRTNGARRRAR